MSKQGSKKFQGELQEAGGKKGSFHFPSGEKKESRKEEGQVATDSMPEG